MRSPSAPYTALTPVSVACTIGRPFSAARNAASDACCSGAQLPWNDEVADWASNSRAPSRVSCLLISGNADSKQTSGPIRVPPSAVVMEVSPRAT